MAFTESWEKALNESSFTDDKDHASCTYARCEQDLASAVVPVSGGQESVAEPDGAG